MLQCAHYAAIAKYLHEYLTHAYIHNLLILLFSLFCVKKHSSLYCIAVALRFIPFHSVSIVLYYMVKIVNADMV